MRYEVKCLCEIKLYYIDAVTFVKDKDYVNLQGLCDVTFPEKLEVVHEFLEKLENCLLMRRNAWKNFKLGQAR